MFLVLLLLLPGLKTEESTLSSLITSRTFKNLPFETISFFKQAKPTGKGPVLFPNDGPSPPPTPLIVTSRPLIESIRRSELNPNNSLQASSQVNQVTFRPAYLDTGISSTPYPYSPTPAPLYEFVRVPFEELPVRKTTGIRELDDYVKGNSYRPVLQRGSSENINAILSEPKKPNMAGRTFPDFEYRDITSAYTNNYRNKFTNGESGQFYIQERSTLPPIYKAFSDHANKVLSQQKIQALREKPIYEYQNPSPDYQNYNTNKGTVQGNNDDRTYGDDYAFSYKVKDHKTGDDFSHSQSSSGSATNGEYRVRLPDGRMQIVSYTADERGYKADVRYDDIEDSNQNKSPPTKQRYDDFDYRYLDNRYAIDSSNKNNNHNANNYEDLNDSNLYVDYADKNKKSFATNYNIDQPLGNLFTSNNSNNYRPIENDNVFYDNDINGDNYSETLNQPSVGDYDQYEEKYYSGEHLNYQPYKSKFTAYLGSNSANSNSNSIKSTVVPPYEEIKHLFVTQNPAYSLSNQDELKDDRVVVIGTKKPSLYTNIKTLINENSVSSFPSYHSTTATPTVTTPGSYLYSTIKNLKNKLNLSVKPILSQEYLNKINKYLELKF